MKKLILSLIAIVGVSVAAAWKVPGFWDHVPQGAKDAVPANLRTYLNMPQPQQAASAQGEQPRGQGQGRREGGAAQGGGQGGGNRGGAGGTGGGRPIPVQMAQATKKSVPVRVESIGTVQAIATVTIRPRIDSQIDEILFQDGANVKAGDTLVRLDSRAVEAQIKQAEATLQQNRASLDLARRTLKRGEELADQNFATKQRLDENRGAVAVQEAQVKANEAALENLRTQLTYYTLRAPITGKAGIANLKPGNIAQSAAAASAITTINQISPIYVAFSVPQRHYAELRAAIERGDNRVEATLQGDDKIAVGKLSLMENTIDNATGTLGVRATFANADETLWPGAIVNVRVTLRNEDNVVAIPREAVQMSQRGSFVFVVVDGVAKMQPVTVGRGVDKDVVILSGLNGGESVITDGQLLVVDGAKVQSKQQQSTALEGQKNRPAGL